MAWDVGKNIVIPGAGGILGGLFGSGFQPYPDDVQGAVDMGANAFGPGGAMPVAGATWQAGLGYHGPVDPNRPWLGNRTGYIADQPVQSTMALHGLYGNNGPGSSVGRFADSNNDPYSTANASWGSLFNTPQTDQNGNMIAPSPMMSAGARTFQGFGGRTGFNGGPVAPGDTDLWKGLTSTAGFYNQDPYMTPGRSVDDLIPMSQWRAGDQYVQDPNNAAYDVNALAQSRGQNHDPFQIGQRGVENTKRLSNQYEDDLMRSIDEEAQRTLSIQNPEVRQQAQMLGLTEGAAAERMGGDVARDVLGQAQRQKTEAMAGFREGNLGRISDAINQRTNVGAQGGMQELQLGAGAYGQGLQSREQALGDIYGASSGLLGQAQQDRQATMRAQQGAMYAGMGAADQSVLNRMIAESNAQSQGQNDYSSLVNSGRQWRAQDLGEMLKLSDYERSISNEQLNQQMQFGMMPMNWLMQLATGVQTGGSPSGGSTAPWWQGAIGAGAGALGSYAAGLSNDNTPQQPLYQPNSQYPPYSGNPG